MPRHFFIIFDQVPIDKQSVKAGENATEVITACRCVNVALFLSHAIRRDVKVSIVTGHPAALEIITFPGDTLRRVSPDERSISFFLLKATAVLEQLQQQTQRKMDNGIIARKTTLDDLMMVWDEEQTHLAMAGSETRGYSSLSCDGVFVYDVTPGPFSEQLQEATIEILPRPTHPERFILDVNMICDSRL